MQSLYHRTNFPIEQYRDDLINEQRKFRDLERDFVAHGKAKPFYQLIKSESQKFIRENFIVAQEVRLHFQDFYGVACKPRYFRQLRGFGLSIHKDINTQCAFNYVMEGPSPLIFHPTKNTTHELHYTKALVNLQVEHSVPPANTDRLLFKLSIMNEKYEEVLKKVLDKD